MADPKYPDKVTKTDVTAPTPQTTETVPPDQLLTEQEQDVYSGGGTGVGPAEASVQSVPVETIESQGIGPRDPYPSADTPPVARGTKPDPFGLAGGDPNIKGD